MAAILAEVAPAVELVTGLSWPEIPETEDTLEGNALLKARAVVAHTGLAALADDTGLEVAALGGRPGVHTARYAGPDASYADNVARLVQEMDDMTDRRARFRTVVALVEPDGAEAIVSGCVDGLIAARPRGDGGFGYDPVFVVGERSLAEMSADEKAAISHRGRALRALAPLLAGAD